MQVEVLNPKAGKLLKNFSDMNLISIKEAVNDNFLKTVVQLRKKNPPSLGKITKEVETARAKRYAKEKK